MAANNYTPLQNQAGTDINKWKETYKQEQAKAEAIGTGAADSAQMQQWMQQLGMAEEQFNNRSQQGTVNADGSVTGGVQRPVSDGTSGADEHYMSDGEYALLQQFKQEYANAQTQAERDAAHAKAEALRARYNYSGGSDGSMYLTGMDYLHQQDAGGGGGHAAGGAGGGAGTGAGTSAGGYDPSEMRSLLDQWKSAAEQQQNAKIDYAVQQAVTELERALADAQPQFKEQAEFVAKEERQALDNSALYAEARGDKGGIGQSQYNEIQAAAAQNHLAVQQAQTKLATDTARQIEDLRAQGEFEKADAALQIAQSYLSELMSLEKWAAEFGLSQAQFQESVRQWEAEFNLAMQQFQVDTDLAYGQLTGTIPSTGQLTLSAQGQLADMGSAMLSAGMMPSADQLAAMGMSESQARQYLTAMQLENASKGGSGRGTSAAAYEPTLTWPQTLAQVEAGNLTPAVLKAYEYYMGTGYEPFKAEAPVKATFEMDNMSSLLTSLDDLLKAGEVDQVVANVDKVWPKMTGVDGEEMRRMLLQKLAQFGYIYEPEG